MKAISKQCLPLAIAALGFLLIGTLKVHADVYINVVAVNGASTSKTSTIHFDLPGELTAEDILDANGLQVDYDVDDANYFVYGDVTLNPKESKTFRIHVRDMWMVTPEQVTNLKNEIEEGYETLGKPHDPEKAQVLKDRLDSRIDYIVNLQSTSADSVDKRIDAYRAYAKEMKRIEDEVLDVDYWRSDPNEQPVNKIIHLNIEATNPTDKIKSSKIKEYLPAEIKPEDVMEAGDFEVRYDDVKQLSFLYLEQDLKPKEDKKYSVGILDIWNIDQSKIDNLRSRAKYASDFLKDTRFEQGAKMLMDQITTGLDTIEASQAVQRTVTEHISAYRDNKDFYDTAEKNVENLEKLLAVFREDLEKSKVENILQKMQSLKGVSDISKVMFNKKFESSTAWSFIGWILLFVGLITLVSFIVSLLRSKDKQIKDAPSKDKA